ncbi:MAG: RNA polymerase sigma factor [Myxococcales bacterium]
MSVVLEIAADRASAGTDTGLQIWSGFCKVDRRGRGGPGGSGVQTGAAVHQLRPRLGEGEAVRADEAVLQALVARIQQNDMAAFDELYRLTRDDVARTLVHLVGRRPDLEDLIQDTFIKLLKAVKTFRGEARFRTFLYRVCANTAFMQLRWWKRRPEEPMAELPERVSSSDPEGEASRRQAARLVEQALTKLKPKKRVVFVYHELCGMGPEEISEIVGTSPNTVRSRLHHARLEFNEAMQRLLTARRGGIHGLP